MTKKGEFDFRMVEDRLLDAAYVWDRLGDKEAAWLYANKTAMPQSLKEYAETWDPGDPRHKDEEAFNRPQRVKEIVTQERIDLAAQCIGWIFYARFEERQVINVVIRLRLRGITRTPWSKIRLILKWRKISRDTVRRRYERGLHRIADTLNAEIRYKAGMAGAQGKRLKHRYDDIKRLARFEPKEPK